MKNKKRLVPWLIAAVIIAALAVIGKKLYDLMFGGSLAVTTEDLKNGIIACSPAIIFIVVVLIAALIVVVAAGKLKQPKRALVRAQAPIAILLAITLSVNWVILGVEYSVVNSVFAENVKVSDETMASGRAIADQIASEGIVLLKNDDKALPLSAGTKLNLFGWSSVRPLYGGTGSGDSDTSNAVSLIDGLKHAGFEVNEELVKFYENFRTERPVGTIRLREIGSKRGDFTVPEPTIAEYENANIFEDAVAYSDTAVVVVSRTGGEGFDIPQSITGPDEYNAQYGGLAQFYDFTTQAEDLDASKSYLELSNREIAMDGNLAIRTGGTKMLAFNITNEFYRDLNSVGTVTAMRNAAHGTLYALANSFAVTRAVSVPKWVKTTYAVDAVVAIILVAWEVCAICKYRKAKKEDEGTEQ